jgi:predicted nicotinamide N-methyase
MLPLHLLSSAAALTPSFSTSGAITPPRACSLPLLPDGRQIDIRESDAGLGGRLWPAAAALCRWQRAEADCIRDSYVIELGCGGGAVSIYAAALGASDVTLTDGGSDDVLDLARANVARNAHLWAGASAVRVWTLRWGETADTEWRPPDACRGWIFGSDVTYSRAAHAALCAQIGALLRQGAGCRAILAHQRRGGGLHGIRSLGGLRVVALSARAPRDRQLEHLVATANGLGLQVERIEAEAEGPHAPEGRQRGGWGLGRFLPPLRQASGSITLLEMRLL